MNTCFKNPAPIVLFCYNRSIVLQKTIAALQKNTLAAQSDLFIYSDAAKPGSEKAVAKVRKILKTIRGFKSIHIRESFTNKGSMNSVKDGITEVIDTYDRVIVFEDDILSSPYTLLYCNKALEKYKNAKNVFCINAMAYLKAEHLPAHYKEDSYFVYRNTSHGWATWKDRWNKTIWNEKILSKEIQNPNTKLSFNKGGNDLLRMLENKIDNQIDSWDIQFSYSIAKHNGLCITPRYSYTSHLDDEAGTHISKSPPSFVHDVRKALENITYPRTLQVNEDIALEFAKVYGSVPQYFYPYIRDKNNSTMHKTLSSLRTITPICTDTYKNRESTRIKERHTSSNKVAHLQTMNVGGAFIAAKRLHQSLWNQYPKNSSNLSSYMFLKKAYPHISMYIPHTYTISGKYSDDLYLQFRNMRNNQYDKSAMFSNNYPSLYFDEIAFLRAFNVIHLHWVSAMLSVEDIAYLSHTDVPLVWTAHDKNILTGGWHDFYSYEAWKRNCNNYRQRKTNDELCAKILKFKKKYWNTKNMTIVALNPNLVHNYKTSPVLKNARIETIYNSIDTTFFTTVTEEEKKRLRKKLRLPQKKTILMYSADYISAIKGYKECLETLTLLENKQTFHLIILGNVANTKNIPISHTYFGHVASDTMKQFYNAADITIMSSLEETLPNIMLESLACGTPLVAFAGVGGCEHFVKNSITGYTVPIGNVAELAQAIEKISQASFEKYRAMCKACRDCATKYFSSEVQAKQYNNLYKSVIAQSKKIQKKPYVVNTSIPQYNSETLDHAVQILSEIVETISKNKWYAFGQLSRKRKIITMLLFALRKLRLYRFAKFIVQRIKK